MCVCLCVCCTYKTIILHWTLPTNILTASLHPFTKVTIVYFTGTVCYTAVAPSHNILPSVVTPVNKLCNITSLSFFTYSFLHAQVVWRWVSDPAREVCGHAYPGACPHVPQGYQTSAQDGLSQPALPKAQERRRQKR